MMNTLSISELHSKFKSLGKSELILDVRTREEFLEGHVPGSKNIPVDEVMNHAAELKSHSAIFIYCRAGRRAQMAHTILESLGVKNLSCVDEGGFPDWEASGFEVSLT